MAAARKQAIRRRRKLLNVAGCLAALDGFGEEGIRTPGSLSTSTVFKTAALNHSATSPYWTFLTNQSLRPAPQFTTGAESRAGPPPPACYHPRSCREKWDRTPAPGRREIPAPTARRVRHHRGDHGGSRRRRLCDVVVHTARGREAAYDRQAAPAQGLGAAQSIVARERVASAFRRKAAAVEQIERFTQPSG
jgi:hypothetical protein